MVEDRDGTASPEQLFAARRLVAIVGQHRPQVPNALARLAMMELRSAAGPTKETLRAIERARLMASGREDYAFIHAQVLAGLSDFDGARKIVGPLMSPAYPPAVRESARNLMRQVLRLQTQSSGGSTEPGAAAPSAAEGTAPAPSDAEPGLSRAAGRRAAHRRRARAHRVSCRRGRRLPPPNGRRPGQRDGGRPRGSGLHHLPERSCRKRRLRPVEDAHVRLSHVACRQRAAGCQGGGCDRVPAEVTRSGLCADATSGFETGSIVSRSVRSIGQRSNRR